MVIYFVCKFNDNSGNLQFVGKYYYKEDAISARGYNEFIIEAYE